MRRKKYQCNDQCLIKKREKFHCQLLIGLQQSFSLSNKASICSVARWLYVWTTCSIYIKPQGRPPRTVLCCVMIFGVAGPVEITGHMTQKFFLSCYEKIKIDLNYSSLRKRGVKVRYALRAVFTSPLFMVVACTVVRDDVSLEILCIETTINMYMWCTQNVWSHLFVYLIINSFGFGNLLYFQCTVLHQKKDL